MEVREIAGRHTAAGSTPDALDDLEHLGDVEVAERQVEQRAIRAHRYVLASRAYRFGLRHVIVSQAGWGDVDDVERAVVPERKQQRSVGADRDVLATRADRYGR